MEPNVSVSMSYYSSKMNDSITFFTLVVKNVLASSPFNLILLMIPQAQRKPMVDKILTFKLSGNLWFIATGAQDRMVHNLRLIRWYHFNLRLIRYCP